MLPRGARLSRARDFAAVYARRRRFDSTALTLSVRRHQENEPVAGTLRLGFVVSKKTAPRAHDRNQLKRRLRAICQKYLMLWPGGFDIVLTARNGARTLGFLELEADVVQLMARAGVYRADG